MQTVWREPILWIGTDGKPTQDHDAKAHAFIQIEVWASDRGRRGQLLAMVDTGATHSIFQSDVLTAIGAPIVGKKEMSGNWSVTTQKTYSIMMRPVGCPGLTVCSDVTELSVAGDFTPKAVIGFDLLRFGKLVLEPGAESFLELRRERLLQMTGREHRSE